MTERIGIGIDLGGSSVKGVAVRASGEVLTRRTLHFSANQPMEWADGIKRLSRDLCPAETLGSAKIGLSAPGLCAADGRSIAYMPGRLQGLEALDWTHYLDHSSVVPVLNDAQAALLGETWLGAARNCRNVFMLTLGTGVGGAAMVDGNLLRGTIGRAGHLGHISLDLDGALDITQTPGSLELMIGNCTVQERTNGRFPSTHELVKAYAANDPVARESWLRSIKGLAAAIASLINVLDPQRVVIGGGIAAAGEYLFKPLNEQLDQFEWRPGGHRVEIVPATLGEFAGALGAAWQAIEAIRG